MRVALTASSLALCALALLACCARPGSTEVQTESRPRLTVELVEREHRWRPYALRLTNDGEEPVTVVRPGDGSDLGWRTPTVTWSVEREGGLPVSQSLMGCGTLNPAVADDILTLGPRESVAFDEWIGAPRLDGPGTYRVAVRLENDPNVDRFELVGGPPEVMAAIRRSTPFVVESEPVTRTVLP